MNNVILLKPQSSLPDSYDGKPHDDFRSSLNPR